MPKLQNTMNYKELVHRMMIDLQNDNNHKLPSEPELMKNYSVTRYTLRKALAELSNLGYIYQAHGIGTFVRPRSDKSSFSIQSRFGLTQEFAHQGRILKTIKAKQQIIDSSGINFKPLSLKISQGVKLNHVMRLRTLDEQPFIVENSYYLQHIIPNIPEQSLYGSLFDFINNNKHMKTGFQDKVISADVVQKKDQKFFNLKLGEALIVMHDASYLNSGELLAFSELRLDFRQANLFMFMKL